MRNPPDPDWLGGFLASDDIARRRGPLKCGPFPGRYPQEERSPGSATALGGISRPRRCRLSRFCRAGGSRVRGFQTFRYEQATTRSDPGHHQLVEPRRPGSGVTDPTIHSGGKEGPWDPSPVTLPETDVADGPGGAMQEGWQLLARTERSFWAGRRLYERPPGPPSGLPCKAASFGAGTYPSNPGGMD